MEAVLHDTPAPLGALAPTVLNALAATSSALGGALVAAVLHDPPAPFGAQATTVLDASSSAIRSASRPAALGLPARRVRG